MVEYTSTGAEHYLELSDTPTEDSLAVNEAGLGPRQARCRDEVRPSLRNGVPEVGRVVLRRWPSRVRREPRLRIGMWLLYAWAPRWRTALHVLSRDRRHV